MISDFGFAIACTCRHTGNALLPDAGNTIKKKIFMDNHEYNPAILSDKYKVIRTGFCDPNKCKSACCKFYMIARGSEYDDYTSGFFEKVESGNFIFKKNCKYLDIKKNKCKIWGTPQFPEVCKQFPHPSDPVYRHVINVCSFKFELVLDENKNITEKSLLKVKEEGIKLCESETLEK